MRENDMNSALLIMDVQQGVVQRYGQSDGLLSRLGQALTAARGAGVPAVFVRVAFRPGFPDVSPANRSFSAITGTAGDSFGENSPATQIHPALALRPGEPVVLKKRVSAFTGSDLEVLLRSMSITHLLLTGIATSGVVLSTLREAADRDYQLTVLADACADADEEIHRVLLGKVFPRQAAVVTVQDGQPPSAQADRPRRAGQGHVRHPWSAVMPVTRKYPPIWRQARAAGIAASAPPSSYSVAPWRVDARARGHWPGLRRVAW